MKKPIYYVINLIVSNMLLLISLQVLTVLSAFTIPLREINATPFEKVSYFKSLQMRTFLGSGMEYPLSNYMDAQFYFELSIGTPAQIFEIIPDSNSEVSWVPSNSCWSLSCFLHKAYKAYLSSSYKPIGNTFSAHYGSGNVRGYYSEDIFAFGEKKVPMVFGEANSFDGPSWMATRFDGVFSLTKLVKELKIRGAVENELFQMNFNGENSDILVGACKDGSAFVDFAEKTHPQVLLQAFILGNIQLAQGLFVIFDLQTPFIIVGTDIFNAVTQTIKVNPDCSNKHELPILKLVFGEITIDLTPEIYILQSFGDIHECLLGIIPLDFPVDMQNTIVIGGFANHHYDLCVDMENSKLGFNVKI